mmetsp:Transcript_35363/g.51950  ORF Transcript_35363/g.51950 Transcript_35363/m.51950 type:complete len:145 (+) Transcript_35363:174-608(+)
MTGHHRIDTLAACLDQLENEEAVKLSRVSSQQASKRKMVMNIEAIVVKKPALFYAEMNKALSAAKKSSCSPAATTGSCSELATGLSQGAKSTLQYVGIVPVLDVCKQQHMVSRCTSQLRSSKDWKFATNFVFSALCRKSKRKNK